MAGREGHVGETHWDVAVTHALLEAPARVCCERLQSNLNAGNISGVTETAICVGGRKPRTRLGFFKLQRAPSSPHTAARR